MSATSISTSTIDEGTELELWDKPHQPRSGETVWPDKTRVSFISTHLV